MICHKTITKMWSTHGKKNVFKQGMQSLVCCGQAAVCICGCQRWCVCLCVCIILVFSCLFIWLFVRKKKSFCVCTNYNAYIDCTVFFNSALFFRLIKQLQRLKEHMVQVFTFTLSSFLTPSSEGIIRTTVCFFFGCRCSFIDF